MSSLTNENTNEMPINNRPTFEPNKHYYYYDDAVRMLGYRGILCIKVDKKTKSGKSIWVMGKYNPWRLVYPVVFVLDQQNENFDLIFLNVCII